MAGPLARGGFRIHDLPASALSSLKDVLFPRLFLRVLLQAGSDTWRRAGRRDNTEQLAFGPGNDFKAASLQSKSLRQWFPLAFPPLFSISSSKGIGFDRDAQRIFSILPLLLPSFSRVPPWRCNDAGISGRYLASERGPWPGWRRGVVLCRVRGGGPRCAAFARNVTGFRVSAIRGAGQILARGLRDGGHPSSRIDFSLELPAYRRPALNPRAFRQACYSNLHVIDNSSCRAGWTSTCRIS